MTRSDDPQLAWVERLALQIEYRPRSTLRQYPGNARTHSKKQIEQIAASIRQFGFVNPILVDEEGETVAGHGRLAAAELLGLDTVPVVRLQHLSPEQKRAYRLADNRLAELAGWDEGLLAIEIEALLEIEVPFEVEITGFDTVDIDRLVDRPAASTKPDRLDEVVEPQNSAVTEIGDLWLLGTHRLLCGDAREQVSYDALMAGEKAQMIFTDPPYNVSISTVSGLGRIQHREFVMASGEMSMAEFTAFLKTVLGNLARVSIDGSIHMVCIDWRHAGELLAAGYAVYQELKNLCVWIKDNGGMGSFYRSRHELVLVFKNGTAPHINNFGLGQRGRYRTNVWEYAGVNSLRTGRQEELAMHPTVKPTLLVADAIKDCSKRNGIILDAFGGSGTTIIAAEKTGRRAYVLELDPLYVDVAVRRWQKLFCKQAHHAATGITFDAMASRRGATSRVASVAVEANHV